jgi:hypothetical protein
MSTAAKGLVAGILGLLDCFDATVYEILGELLRTCYYGVADLICRTVRRAPFLVKVKNLLGRHNM